MTIELNDIEKFLVAGWINTERLNLSRLIDAGTVVTVILSNGEFSVPDTMPGGAIVLDSRQHAFTDDALMKIRVVTRSE